MHAIVQAVVNALTFDNKKEQIEGFLNVLRSEYPFEGEDYLRNVANAQFRS